MATPPPPAPGAELDTYTITDLLVDTNGLVTITVDTFADKNNANDVTIVNTSTEPITLIKVEKLGDNDGQSDVVRIDLSEFDDDFTLDIRNTGSTVTDYVYIEGVHEYIDNGDGTFTATYYGTDDNLHSILILPDNATVVPYYAPDGIVTGTDGADVMGDGYADIHEDEIGAGDGDINDSIIGGTGSDTIFGGDGNDTIAGDFAALSGLLDTSMPPNTYSGSPSGPAPGAEVDSFTINDVVIDANGKVTVQVDTFALKTNANDVTVVHGGTEAITQIDVTKFGDGDGQADVIRFDLSTYDDDFLVNIANEDEFDKVIFEGVHRVTDNGDGTWDISYFGTDSLLHYVTVNPDTASVEFYVTDSSPYFYDDVIDAGDGDDIVDAGLGNDSVLGGIGADTLDGGDGSDTIDGGAGDDVIIGDRTAPESLRNTLEYSYAQDLTGNQAAHFGEQYLGTANDPMLLFDNDESTEVRYHDGDIIEYAFGQELKAGSSITLIEPTTNGVYSGVENAIVDIYVSFGSTDPNGDTLSGSGGGVGYENAVTNGQSVLIYSGPADSTIDLVIPIDATHIQFVAQGSHAGWGEIEFTELVVPLDPGDDSLVGGEGHDTIDGGAGNDTLDGGSGDDVFLAGTGTDSITGGTGTDTYDASASDALSDETITVTVDALGDGTVSKTNDGTTDSFTSIENFVAGEGAGENDTIVITENVDATSITGFSDSTTGVFTPLYGTSGPISFGGVSEPTINQILSGDYIDPTHGRINAAGEYSVTGGEEDGATVGTTSFSNFENAEFGVVCFVRGTRIATVRGEIAIEDLREGDLVQTMDHGLQEVRWIGSTVIAAEGRNAPIEIRKGALGNARDLRVSPQHRMLVQNGLLELLVGETEALVPAKHLVNGRDILRIEGGEVEYFHMLFDTHEIVFAEGIPSESLYPGTVGTRALADESREEIFRLFPELRENLGAYGETARICLKEYEAALLRAA